MFKKMVYLVSLTAIGYIFYRYWDYYTLPYALRPRHELYNLLKPGGLFGHGVGIIGSAMMILLLLYSVRKRTRLFGRFGAVSRWLDVHIFFGTIGPLLIVLHSTFKLNGIVSISFWSMVSVALSGFVGRYLYIQIPRTLRGRELTLEEIDNRRRALREELMQKYHLEEREIHQVAASLSIKAGQKTLLGLLFGMALADIKRLFTFKKVKRTLMRRHKISKNEAVEFLNMVTEKALLERRKRIWERVHTLFHYWHVFHKPFAIIMYLIMIIHVSVSVWLGYTWIF
ncbi:MAG: hypothetical protein D6677_04945 [Calditrichaeota bacterium]|nr:MAG: hypothetical protein D6677_04945 [Calditrichota bacterium]